MEYEAWEISCPQSSPNRSFRVATWVAQDMKKEAKRQKGEDPDEVQGQEKLGFFSTNKSAHSSSFLLLLAGRTEK